MAVGAPPSGTTGEPVSNPATGKINPTYKLTPTQRLHISIITHLGLWPRYRIAEAYGVTSRTVQACTEKHPAPLPWCREDGLSGSAQGAVDWRRTPPVARRATT